jgi:hypothetical protein
MVQKQPRMHGRAVAREVSRQLPTTAEGFKPGSGHMGFVVDNAAMGQVFCECFGFPYQAFYRQLHTYHHSSSGAGKIGQ